MIGGRKISTPYRIILITMVKHHAKFLNLALFQDCERVILNQARYQEQYEISICVKQKTLPLLPVASEE